MITKESCYILAASIAICIGALFSGAALVFFFSRYIGLRYEKVKAYVSRYVRLVQRGTGKSYYKIVYSIYMDGEWQRWEGTEFYSSKFLQPKTPCYLWYSEELGFSEFKPKGRCLGILLGFLLMIIAVAGIVYSAGDFISLWDDLAQISLSSR